MRTAAELEALRQRAANMRFREVAALVEEQGWTLARIRGGHHIYSKAGARRPRSCRMTSRWARRAISSTN